MNGPYTLHECKSARRAAEALSVGADSRAMRDYWQGVADMWAGRERTLERESLRQLRKPTRCPGSLPQRYGHDEMRCNTCGIIWERGEPKPRCPEIRKEL